MLYGTALLLASNIFVKGLGFFYRIVLVRTLGVEAMGLIEMVTPLFSLLLVVGGLGVQPALSQLIAARRSKRDAYFQTGLRLLLLSGLLVTALGYMLSAFLIRNFVPDTRIYLCFKLLLPAIFIISAASAYRGYFQGVRQVSTLALSQNVEQLLRVVCGIWLAKLLCDRSVEIAVGATSVATVCGETAGLLCLLICARRGRLRHRGAALRSSQLRDILSFGLPTTGGRLVSSIVLMLQAFLIPLSLQAAGWDTRAATEIYGRFAGVAMSLLHLPGVFTAALTVSVLPAVAESMSRDPQGRLLLQRRVNDAFEAAVTFTLPCMLLLYCFAEQLCAAVFTAPLAAPILRLLAIGGVFLYLQITAASVLQGLGAARILLLNNIIGGVILLAGVLLLTTLPQLGILGAAIAVIVAWCGGFILNCAQILRIAHIRIRWWQTLLRPAAAVAAALTAWLLLPSGQSNTAALLVAAMMAAVYALTLFALGGLRLKRP
ncbi:MAG: polysaccharide biosynthesis protein [Bacillota bacterium]|nr:polysaccharide biosynthesis protein [Bacillota bacterium]